MYKRQVNNLAMNKSHNWFENNVIFRVPSNFPGEGRRVYPGFLQHTGFVAMNPSNHANSHYDYFKDLIKGDDASTCLLYTSDAADERSSVDLGGRRIIKKKKNDKIEV